MEGMFFSRFDYTHGAILVCQASVKSGEKVMPHDVFDRVSDYVVARKELCGSVLICSDRELSGSKVMTIPQVVEDTQVYARNTFTFGFGFVFKADAQTGPYVPVLRKLSNVMRSMEVESGFLSSAKNDTRIGEILDRALSELSHTGECIVQLDDFSVLALHVTPRTLDPPEVYDFQVPVQIRELEAVVSKDWDLTILRVLEYVDGQRHIKLIAELSGVAVALVRRCVRQLLYFRCVKLVDIFQYSNTYRCTPDVVKLVEDPVLERMCLQYISNSRIEQPSLGKVFQLYTSLQPCTTYSDFCTLNDIASHNIDDRRFVTFGIMHGLIARVHTFAVYPSTLVKEDLTEPSSFNNYFDNVHSHLQRSTPEQEHKTSFASSFDDVDDTELAGGALQPHNLVPLLNGRNCVDAICTELWVPSAELEATLGESASVAVVKK